MKLQFLWGQEKTRKLFKRHIILFAIGASLATVYTLLLPAETNNRLVLTLIPLSFVSSCPIYFFLLERKNPSILLLIFTMQSQLAASIFMAIYGGFFGILQFAPFMLLLFAVFELGPSSTLILGFFSLITFQGVLFWTLKFHPKPSTLPDFIYYVGSYILILIIEHNIGKEISLQFEERKRLEQIDDLKNQFITLTSHYLRTPLTIFKGFFNQFDKTNLSQKQKSEVDQVYSSIKQLELMVEELLTISSIEKGQAKISIYPADLNSIITKTIEEFRPLAEKRQISLIYQPTQIDNFNFDQDKIKEAISSLIDNAIKFNNPSGKVTIMLSSEKRQAKIIISDTGVGISKEHLSTLFTTFSRGSINNVLQFDRPGMGLSLYFAKLIIEAHQGKITVSSTPGQGSTFTVTLPMIKAPSYSLKDYKDENLTQNSQIQV